MNDNQHNSQQTPSIFQSARSKVERFQGCSFLPSLSDRGYGWKLSFAPPAENKIENITKREILYRMREREREGEKWSKTPSHSNVKKINDNVYPSLSF